jgi:hypothetical protein
MTTKREKQLEAELAALKEVKSKHLLSGDELQQIKTDLVNTLNQSVNEISLKVEKSVLNNVLNWCSHKIISILFIVAVPVVTVFWYTVFQNNEIQNLKIENQNIKIIYQNRINELKFQSKKR